MSSVTHAPHAIAGAAAPGADGGAPGQVDVTSPGVGLWEPALRPGQLVRPGDAIGWLHVLGAAIRVDAPATARGVVIAIADGAAGRARVPVGHGARLYRLDPSRAAEAGAAASTTTAASTAGAGLAFAAPTSGRFYGRPAPGKPPFVAVGDVIRDGHTVCMLEVMKTFNRVIYDAGELGLPEAARVTAIEVVDEQDVEAGAVILRLEPA